MNEIEDRLRAALAARAGQVDDGDLVERLPPGDRVGDDGRITGPMPVGALRRGARPVRWAPALTTAAAAAVVALAVLTGLHAGRMTSAPGGDGALPATGGTATALVSDGLTAATAAAGSTPAGGPTQVAGSTPVPAGRACRSNDLLLSVLGDAPSRSHGAGMNHHGATISVVNIGAGHCSVNGYLGIGMYDVGGRLVSAAITLRGGGQYADDPGPRPVQLQPGGSAFTELEWTSADGRTQATDVVQLRVIAPGDTQQLSAPLGTVLGGDGQVRQTALTATPLPLRG